MLLISVIVRTTDITNQTELEQALQPKDGSRVLLRRFGTSICICMRPNGTVTTERFVNLTVSDDCEWHLRISRHGLGFEHHIGSGEEDTIESGTSLNTIRIATLSVTDNTTQRIAPGWLHRVGEPEARWIVGSSSSTLRQMIEKLHKQSKSGLSKIPGQFPTAQVSSSHNKSSSKPSIQHTTNDTRQSMRVGKQEVISSGAQVHHLENLLLNAQKQHCEKLRLSINKLVIKEISLSLGTMDEFRKSFHQMLNLLRQFPPNKLLLTNGNLTLTFQTVGHLLDDWLMRTNQKWRLKLFRLNKRGHRKFEFLSPYSLTILRLGDKQIAPNDHPLDRRIERKALNRIYHDLLQLLNHLAKWSSSEKLNWLKKPRLIGLFRAIGIEAPPPPKLRLSLFLLTQYLPNLIPPWGLDHTLNPLVNYGVLGQIDRRTLNNQFLNNVNFMNMLNRASHMKFEQVRFWSSRISEAMHFPNPLLHAEYEKIEHEIRMLDNQSACFQSFLNTWKQYRQEDSTSLSLHR